LHRIVGLNRVRIPIEIPSWLSLLFTPSFAALSILVTLAAMKRIHKTRMEKIQSEIELIAIKEEEFTEKMKTLANTVNQYINN